MSDKPLPGFSKLNDLISIHRPNNVFSSKANPSNPDLIVICSWMGAAPKHIAKYTDTYRRLYPQASILLIQAVLATMIVGVDIDPAPKVLASLDKSDQVILHAFSNGGARSASALAVAINAAQTPCPFRTTIFDCCPGTADVSSIATAISISLPGWHVVRSLGFVAMYVLAAIFMIVAKVLRMEDAITVLRRNLNDPRIVPVEVPRLYLYSKADKLVAFKDVSRHAADARGKGYRGVREEVFQKAPHCALVNEDGERYWDAVKEVVKSASKGG